MIRASLHTKSKQGMAHFSRITLSFYKAIISQRSIRKSINKHTQHEQIKDQPKELAFTNTMYQ